MTLSEIINAGLNNPDCSFYVGMSVGQFSGIKTMFLLGLLYITMKFVEGLAVTPLLVWIKSKFKKVRR